MDRYDMIIIGAGISGLSLAHWAVRSGRKTLVIEQSDRTGGCFHSHRFSGDAAGFWLELGAHTCYNSYDNLLCILEERQLLDRLLRREKVSFKMLVDSRIRSIPSQLNFLELLLSLPRLFTLKKNSASVASYYAKIVGQKNYERVFAPAFNAVLSQRADEFPADMLFNKRPGRRKEILKSFTLDGGLQTITDTLAAAPALQVATGTTVVSLSHADGVFRLVTQDGRSIESSALALATPPPVAARLLQVAFPELAGQLAQIRMETIETVGVAIRKEALTLGPVAGIIAVNDAFYSAVSRDTVPHDRYRGFSFHFRAGELSYDEKLRRIGEVLAVGPAELSQVVTRESRLPSPVVGHRRITGEIDRLLAGKRLLLTGNYFAGLAIEDCVTRSQSEFSRLAAIS